jgi:hypothetical protein
MLKIGILKFSKIFCQNHCCLKPFFSMWQDPVVFIDGSSHVVVQEATRFHFFVAVTLGTETILSDF